MPLDVLHCLLQSDQGQLQVIVQKRLSVEHTVCLAQQPSVLEGLIAVP